MEFEDERFFLGESTEQLSAGGALVTTSNSLPVGSRCRFELRLTPKGPVVEGTGEVVHVEPGEEAEDRMGIRFLTVDEAGARLLIELSAAYHTRGPDAFEARLRDAAAAWESRKLEEESTEPLGPPGAEDLPDTERMTPIRPAELSEAVSQPAAAAEDEEAGRARARDLDDTAPIPPPSLPDASEEPEEPEAASVDEPAEAAIEGTRMFDLAEASLPEEGPETPEAEALVDGDLRVEEDASSEDDGPREEFDPLSKTLDIAAHSRNLPRDAEAREVVAREAEGRSGSGRWLWAAGLVFAGLAAWLVWNYRGALPAPQLVASDELPGWEDREPYRVVEDPDPATVAELEEEAAAASAEPAPASPAAPAAAAIAPVRSGTTSDAESDTPGEEPFRALRDVQWERRDGELWIDLGLDGAVAVDRIHTFRTPEDPPRIVVQLFGVVVPYPLEELGIDSDLVRAIRLGYHAGEDSEQRVVLDLARPEVTLRRVESRHHALRVVLAGSDAD